MQGVQHGCKLAVVCDSIRPQTGSETRFPGQEVRSQRLNPGLHGLVAAPDGSPASHALATRRGGPGKGLTLGVQQYTNFLGIRFDEVAVRIEGQVAEPSIDCTQVGRGRCVGRQPEPEGEREGEEARRLEAEESPRDLIAQFVVLGAADSMDEQVAEQEPAEHGRRQGPGAQSDRAAGSSRSRSTAQQASPSGDRGKAIKTWSSPSTRSSTTRGSWRASSARRRGWPARQTQNGASSQSSWRARAATGWCRLRMRWAARYSARHVLWTS